MGRGRLDNSLAGPTETPHQQWQLGHGQSAMEPKKPKETHHFEGDGRGSACEVQGCDLVALMGWISKVIRALKMQTTSPETRQMTLVSWSHVLVSRFQQGIFQILT